jgi:acyl-CoA reductase-like NAD-dependent aldehyde dehydrogenase
VTAVPDPRFRDQLAEVWCDDQESGDPWDQADEHYRDYWRRKVDRLLLPAIAAHVEAEVQAATKAARREQETWDRRRVEDYAAVVGLELDAHDDVIDAVNELYLAAVQAATNQRAADELTRVTEELGLYE